MPSSRSSLLLPLALACLASCSPAPSLPVSIPGAMQLAVALPAAASPAEVSRVTVTVSGPDMSPLTTRLVRTDGAWGGVLGDIPAGTPRAFVAQAFNAADTVRYEGRADNVTVTAGATGLVSLTLQDVTPSPPLDNAAPVVDVLVATPTTVAPGGSVSLTATVRDPNPGDTLSYAWSAPSGTFSAPTQASTTWTAPGPLGPVRLALQVSDSRGAVLQADVTVEVSRGRGTTEVKTGFNTAPTLTRLASSQGLLAVGQSTALSVTASDAEGDSLSYQWSATCAGTFSTPTAPSTTFTPSALPGGACNNCQLTVRVDDGRGARNTSTLALCVAQGPQSQLPPQLTASYQSSSAAWSTPRITLEVSAQDAQDSTLGFAWTASAGTLGTADSTALSSRILWMPPPCDDLKAPASAITATVTNTAGLSTTRVFNLPVCAPANSWYAASGLSEARYTHVSLLLSNGKVLAAAGHGGDGKLPLASAELYDPATRTWSPTGPMTAARSRAAAALLSTGKVLVSGGASIGGVLATAELYDPDANTWSATGPMTTPRVAHKAVRLPDGKVLVLGGGGGAGSAILASAELYDPATGTWSTTGSMASPRFGHTALLLPNGKVLALGGNNGGSDVNLASAELYDPATGTWRATGSMASPRLYHQATSLPDGKVLVTGGITVNTVLASAELYDPATGTWSAAPAMSAARSEHTATLLLSGKVLIAQGYNAGPVGSAEVYDPAAKTWTFTSAVVAPRRQGEMTRLSTGHVLFSGGLEGTVSSKDVQLYTPGTSP